MSYAPKPSPSCQILTSLSKYTIDHLPMLPMPFFLLLYSQKASVEGKFCVNCKNDMIENIADGRNTTLLFLVSVCLTLVPLCCVTARGLKLEIPL